MGPWSDSIHSVSDDLVLFGDDDRQDDRGPVRPAPITDWQIDLLRKALDARGLATMEDRQRAIQDAAGRPVESLRSLTHDEALQVLARLGKAPSKQAESGSLWDDRSEDTWIDRL